MNREEALEVLADGHSVLSVEAAKKVCAAIGVLFGKHLVEVWHSDPPGTFKGLTMNPEWEGREGVSALSLSNYVAAQLGADGGSFIGRGFQAQANARAIREKLEEK